MVRPSPLGSRPVCQSGLDRESVGGIENMQRGRRCSTVGAEDTPKQDTDLAEKRRQESSRAHGLLVTPCMDPGITDRVWELMGFAV